MSLTTRTTIGSLFESALAAAPDRDLLVFPDQRLTYAELAERVHLAQRALIGLGITPGEHVGVLMQNCPDHLALMIAISSIGAVDVPVNTRNRSAELAHVITDARMPLVITSTLGQDISDLPGRLSAGVAELATLAPRIIVLDSGPGRGIVDSAELAAAAAGVDEAVVVARTTATTGEDVAVMLYTSGTTANPKGCPLRHRQLVSISSQVGQRWGTREGDTMWDALPYFHASSILPFLACLAVRGTFVSAVVFEPAETIRMLRDERPDLAWPAFGTVWQEILTHPTFTPDAVESIRAAMTVAPPETIHVMEQSAPTVALMSCYGITEGLGIPIMVRHDDDARTRTETGGLPFDGIEVQIRDPQTRVPLPPGERGSIWLRGENVFDGYWGEAAHNAEVFDDDGWFDTGDLGDMDERGTVTYRGRLKDMLKVGGENVAAVEIEACLSTHPAVKLAAVVGVPDEKYDEVPAAFLELRPGADATSEEVVAFCRERLAGFKVPRHVRFVTEWPMSATKIRKVDLQRQLTAELGTPSA